MTITSIPSTTAQAELELWRAEMIDLALEVYDSGEVDLGSLVLISNALYDIRVRDSIIWYMSTIPVDGDGLDMIVTLAVEDAKNNGDSAPMACIAATACLFMNDAQSAAWWTAKAITIDPRYSYANLLGLTLSLGLDADYRKMVFDVGYEASRYGK